MRNKTLNSYLCIALLLLAQIPFLGNLQAQSTLVKGTVLDAEGGMPGVNVTVKGTTNGTITDIEGNFSISMPGGNSVLIFSYIGYITEEVTVGNQT
ncbi:MAG: carboxypeptidase-like regulatory domain-containing protein [Bacteroides sp.]|nr:carboxypeptidase-like regulatory domain-containing protein [Bacteroides sp.]